MSSPNLQLIRDALDNYAEQMKIDLQDNPFAEEIDGCDSPGAILQLLERNRDEFKEYRDKNRKFINCLNPVVQFVHAFSGILGEATGLIPFQPAKLVFVGINVLFTAAEGVSASYDALLDLFECIGNFLKRLEIYTKIDLSPLMTEIIVKIMVELLSILSQAKKQIKQGRFKQFAKKLLGDSEIESILRRLDRLTQDEARMTDAHILEVVHGLMNNMKVVMDGGEASIIAVRKTLVAMQDVVNEINKMNRDRLHENTRSWLSPPDPSENQVIARRDIRDGSTMWFTRAQIFEEWNATGCLLWIRGKPGSGKSILCSTIIKESMALRDAGLGLTAYYYFDFRNTAKQDVRGLLSSLLVQLCAKSDSCYKALFRLYSTHDNGSQLPDDRALAKCLKDMLGLPEQPTIYLVVDALDECPNTSGVVSPRDRVLELVEDLVESHLPNLRICVTGRPEADIIEALKPLASHIVSLHDEDGQKQDIVDYVTSAVHSDRKMRKWRAEDKNLVIDTISEKADGMFRWVFCQLEALRRCIPGTIARALKELPQTLDETYERILLSIDKNSQEYVCCLFRCLCVSVRPLRLAELAEVLSILFDDRPCSEDHIDWRSEGAQQSLLSACSSLVTVINIDDSPVVQFAHFSVREYLTSDRLANATQHLSPYHVFPHLAHTILAQASLRVLLDFDGRLDKSTVEKHPLAIYAARHWIDHAKFEGESPSIQGLMNRLFDRNAPYFAAWVWIYDFDRPSEEQMATTCQNQPGASPLYYASLCGLLRVVEHLAVTCPEDVNARGGHYVTPLYAALTNRQLDAARALLRHGADINAPGMNGFNPLHSASLGGDLDAVRLLLEHHADINAKTYMYEGGFTLVCSPLYFSALAGQLEVCRLLLEHGADVGAKGQLAESPLQAASRGGHSRVVKLLLDNGASDFRDRRKGHTALTTASARGHAEIVRILIESDTDIASRKSKMSISLDLASRHGHLDIVRDLLVSGADVQSDIHETPLHLASRGGFLGIVQLLVQHGAALDKTDLNQDTPLHLALRHRKFEVAHFLIEHRANIISQGRDGQTPLHHASQHGVLDLVEVFLKAGVDVNIRNANEKTPLLLALGSGKLDVARFLIERGADVDASGADRSSPLHSALANGHIKVAELLVERGADVNRPTSSQEAPLLRALVQGEFEFARFLIKFGADINAEDADLSSPLHVASAHGHLEVAELLVERGADVNKQNGSQRSPLHRASSNGKLKVVRFLVKCGSSVGLRDSEGRTSLHAAARGGHLDVVELLLESGADINVRDGNNETPFFLAYHNGKAQVATFLAERSAPPDVDQLSLEDEDKMTLHAASARGRWREVESFFYRGANVNTLNVNLRTPLHVASAKGRSDVVRLLIRRGADVNCRDRGGHTPLHMSSHFGHLDIARLLLDRGAHVDTTNRNCLTPLYYASSQGCSEIVQLLLERGANVNAVSDDGSTPLQGARLNKKRKVAQLLIKHGAS